MRPKKKKKSKNPNPEYELKQEEISSILKKIEVQVSPNVNPMKARILHTSIENVRESVRYYFNQNTTKIIPHQDTMYINAVKQIRDITKFVDSKHGTTQYVDFVKENLMGVNNEFAAQHKYVKRVQVEFEQKKKDRRIIDAIPRNKF